MKKFKMGVWVEPKMHLRYKKFCEENGLVMSKRIEELMRADLEKRLIKIPKVEF